MGLRGNRSCWERGHPNFWGGYPPQFLGWGHPNFWGGSGFFDMALFDTPANFHQKRGGHFCGPLSDTSSFIRLSKPLHLKLSLPLLFIKHQRLSAIMLVNIDPSINLVEIQGKQAALAWPCHPDEDTLVLQEL